jgi:hypothetical protein
MRITNEFFHDTLSRITDTKSEVEIYKNLLKQLSETDRERLCENLRWKWQAVEYSDDMFLKAAAMGYLEGYELQENQSWIERLEALREGFGSTVEVIKTILLVMPKHLLWHKENITDEIISSEYVNKKFEELKGDLVRRYPAEHQEQVKGNISQIWERVKQLVKNKNEIFNDFINDHQEHKRNKQKLVIINERLQARKGFFRAKDSLMSRIIAEWSEKVALTPVAAREAIASAKKSVEAESRLKEVKAELHRKDAERSRLQDVICKFRLGSVGPILKEFVIDLENFMGDVNWAKQNWDKMSGCVEKGLDKMITNFLEKIPGKESQDPFFAAMSEIIELDLGTEFYEVGVC